jgi:ABC-type multidrug transport system fused ATPase/permease subunit
LRYRSQARYALNDVTFDVQPAERVGIVGRTGSGAYGASLCVRGRAGKSSLGFALFRVYAIESGEISIDGVNIASIGLHELRTKIDIIPQVGGGGPGLHTRLLIQDPQLFTGTVRFNLDSARRHTDEQLWDALERTHMKDKARFCSNFSNMLWMNRCFSIYLWLVQQEFIIDTR